MSQVKPPAHVDRRGRAQARKSQSGARHTDFRSYYSHRGHSDLWRTNLRFLARTPEGTFDLGPLVEQAQWQDVSSDVLTNLNSYAALTGSLQLRKPALHQYHKLLPSFLADRIQKSSRTAPQGALGVVIVCEVGYGASYVPTWAMRVVPGSVAAVNQNSAAEQVTLSDGAWNLSLSDDLFLLSLSVDDFQFTKGRVRNRQGWRAHQIAAAVCAKYRIPVRTLAKGTSWMSLNTVETTATSPAEVIQLAYQNEQNATGRIFVIKWGAPDRHHPFGALEVTPLRRNKTLLVFRDQLTEAILTRSQSPQFATVIEARGTLQSSHGKNLPIKAIAKSDAGIKRYGWVYRISDFGPVSSHAELTVLAKRALASVLAPLRSAEVVNPGVASIRRGDAIRIDIPEEGYAALDLNADGTPRMPAHKKQLAGALAAAEKTDPTMFALPDPSLLSPTGAASSSPGTTNTLQALTSALPYVLPVADQGIAFVTSAQHTVSAGSYQVDISTGFVDILDPSEVQAEIDAAIRMAKAPRTGSVLASAGSALASGGGWITIGASVDPTQGQAPTYPDHGGMSFAELLQAGTNRGLHPTLTEVLGLSSGTYGMAMETAILIRMPGSSTQYTIYKNDVGSGQAGDPYYKIDLHPGIAAALGVSATTFLGSVQVKRAS
jgi:hypothetical protein